MTSSNVIALRNVSKSYRLVGRRSQFQTLKSALLRREWKPTPEGSITALQNISFELTRGEAFGIIGRNGSGKSTLLKIISGILKPTHGEVIVDGRVSALIELGAGFHPEISGRENIYINGIMLGLSRREIDARIDRIIDFAGIREFLDQPVKTYSSGMYVRLGFAVAVHVDPDILIVDEVLAVGDEEFSSKCIAKIQEMKYKGTTLLFVTHQLGLVREICDRALWLDHGVAAAIGDPVRVVDQYLQAVAGRQHVALPEPNTELVPAAEELPGEPATLQTEEEKPENDLLEEERWGSGEVILKSVSMLDERGRDVVAIGTPTPLTIELKVEVRSPQTDFVFGIGIYHADGSCVFGTNTDIELYVPEKLESDGIVRFVIPSLELIGGSYRIDAAVHTKNGRAFDYRRGVIRFVVGSRYHEIGVYRPTHEWQFEGGISLTRADDRRNVPAVMAETLKELGDDKSAGGDFKKRRTRNSDR